MAEQPMRAFWRRPEILDRLIWVLVYGGLLAVALGWSVGRRDDVLGWTVAGAGAIAALLGAALVIVRARLKEERQA